MPRRGGVWISFSRGPNIRLGSPELRLRISCPNGASIDARTRSGDLQARGVVFESYEMPKTENGVAQMPAGRGAWFKDPDGNLLGLFEFADPI